MKISKIITSSLLIISVLLFTGCKKEQSIQQANKPIVTLNYYKIFDNEENLRPIFNKYQQVNPNVRITYRNFTDPEKYLDTILSELAEGNGPDIISVPNTWIAQNYKKLSAAPANLASPQAVRDAFVQVVEKDNVFIDTDGIEKVFGIPLYVDTLGLYYNKDLFEKTLPEYGKPATTWSGIKQMTEILSLPDTNNNLIRSGIAIGTGEGILRSADIFNLMLLQKEVPIFDNSNSKYNFASNSKTSEVTELYKSFNNLSSNSPSWQDSLGSTNEKEIYAFATGKTAMIFGYSYLYPEILRTIEIAKRNGEETINPNQIKISEAPQFDSNNKIFLANYNSETVTKNSKNTEEAWKLITYLADPVNLKQYYKNSYKPTSRRELITEQRTHKIYGVFANQLGTATSIISPDSNKSDTIIKNMLDQIQLSDTFKLRANILQAQNELNKTISAEGAFPPAKNKLAK